MKPFVVGTVLFVIIAFLPGLLLAEKPEFRGFWVDAFNTSYTNSAQVEKIIADTRVANCNAIVVEVRKRGDAFYDSKFEPRAAGVGPKYDPLKDFIQKAHDTTAGPRIEVHAWMIVYPVWRGADGVPRQDHPFVKHPEWLDRNTKGATFDGRNYSFDPGHPEAQEHIFNVAMDIVKRYDIVGLHLDRIHYTDTDWGYNPTSVARFNQRFARTGQPATTDREWTQFRRNQVTDLLRKIYLSTIAVKPMVEVSVASITWPPVPIGNRSWADSSAYSKVFQDWKGWMEEGILDINMPMIYLKHEEPRYAAMYPKWLEFVRDNRYNRHAVIAPALYLNTISNSLVQIRACRDTGLDGVALYSYGSYSTETRPREDLIATLTKGENRDAHAVFGKAVATPEMPWKTKPTTGHLKGFVFLGTKTNTVDGATVSLKGPKNRQMTTDATGFYGAVDLPPGNYELNVSFDAHQSKTNQVRISAGNVKTIDVHMPRK